MFNELSGGLGAADVNVVRIPAGMGHTTILQALHATTGGVILAARQFLNRFSVLTQHGSEETILDLFGEKLRQSKILLVDDFHVLEVVNHYNYTRTNLINVVMTALLDEAAGLGKKPSIRKNVFLQTVVFEAGNEGLYRQLLTIVDGLESAKQ